MNDIIPLKVDQEIKADAGFDFLNKFGLSLNANSLLPILFIFMNSKNGAGGFNIFNNFLNNNSLGGIFSKLNLSSANIERSLKTLNSINSQGTVSNSSLIGTATLLLETMYKFTAFQELTSKFNTINNVPNSRNTSKVAKGEGINNNEINFKMLDAITELLDDNSKTTIKSGMEIFKTMSLFQDVNKAMGKETGSNKGGFDISNILGLIGPMLGPLLGQMGGGNLNGMGDMVKMMEMFSGLNSNQSSGKGNSKDGKTNKRNNKKKTFNKDKAIDITDYDEDDDDDDLIDDLLDDLMSS